jgi:hypothetical protein
MLLGLFKDATSWFVGLAEAAGALAAVLLVGLVVGMGGFWSLSYLAKKLAGPTADLDVSDDPSLEMDDAEVVSTSPDEDSPP